MQFKTYVAGANLLAVASYANYRQRQMAQAENKFSLPYFQTAVKNSPQFEKRKTGGEDSWLVSDDSKLIAVADGNGQGKWKKK
jgi:hypothetical protein